MLAKNLHIVFIAATAVLFVSCKTKEYARVQKSQNLQDRYSYAQKMYDNGDYKKALHLYEDIQSYMKGRENFEDMTFQMAYSYYYTKDYFMAATVFQNYTRLFPTNRRVEEAFYMAALSTMLDASYYKLDQSQSKEAIKLFQLFVNYYPKSDRVKEANAHIDQLRERIGKKYFELADNYLKRGLYNSADIAYRGVIKDYSETSYREKAMYKDIIALYKYADNSIEAKQTQRFKDAISAYETFERSYPESSYLKDALKYKELAQKKLSKK
ncbi:MAG: outer membrane protein assembly factor BamD [Bacteroidales bacterium]|nr:outer membrane protein assembly factor BamD [Bacteroidales bacterium]